jgi:peptidoglycan/LPS O-acetylase OafA/YrhL
MEARRGEPKRIRKFYIRRFFRMVPLFYLMLFIYWLRDAFRLGVVHPVSEVLVNASLLFNLIPSHITGFVWASWTISVMVIFYLIFPVIYQWVRTLPAALIFFFAAALMAWGWSHFVLNYGEATGYLKTEDVNFTLRFGFLEHLPAFVCGIIIYRLLFGRLDQLNEQKRRRLGWACLILFIPFYAALLTDEIQNLLWGWSLLHGVCFSLLVLGLGLNPLRGLVNGITAYLGKTTYAMYLLHPLIIFSIIPVYRRLYDILPIPVLGYTASLAATLGMLIPLSLVLYRYVERRGMAWGEKIVSGIQ